MKSNPSSSLGFSDPFIHENKIYVARFFGKSGSEKMTLENSFENLYNLTRSKEIESKIIELINDHKGKIYFQTFY